MKKICVVLMALMLACAMTFGAVAEGAPTLYSTAKNVNWIIGTNWLEVEGSSGSAISDLDGNMLTGTMYTSFTRDTNIVTAAQVNVDELNYMGAFDMNGTPIIPFQYGVIDVLNENWAAAIVLENATAEQYDYSSYSGGYYLITAVDIYNLASGTCVANLTRAQYGDAYAIEDIVNIMDRTSGVVSAYDAQFNVLGTNLRNTYDDTYATEPFQTFRENGQYGLKDAAGNVILPPSYQSIYDFRYGYAPVYDGTHESLIDENGTLVVPLEFDNVKTMSNMPVDENNYSMGYTAYGYFCIQQDDKIGYVNDQGVVTCEPKYSKNIVNIQGISLTYTDMEGKQHILAADGVDTVIDGYERVAALSYMSGVYYKTTSADYKYGVIDWHGNEIFPCEYDRVSPSGDGQYLLLSKDLTNMEIYKMNYDLGGVTPATEAPVAETAGDTTSFKSLLDMFGAGAANEAPAAEAPAAEAAVDVASVKALLDSAKLLLSTDAAANKDAALSLIGNANAMLADSNPSVTTLLDTAITLLTSDAAANGATVVTVLDSALSLM